MKELILIKLGGSVITDKSKPYFAKKENIARLSNELKFCLKKTKAKIILGHGGGSFPHTPATKYKTKQGAINKNSLYGASLVEDAARQLNMIIIENLLKLKVPAFTFSPSSFLISDAKVCSKSYFDPIKKALQIGIMPVIYGDVIIDKVQGCTIFSTEKILSILAEKFEKDYKVSVIYVTDVNGVYDKNGKTISEISSKNFKSLKPSIIGAKGMDVTGGMLHKVEEALNLAKKTGISIFIVNGTTPNMLKNVLLGKIKEGVTKITSN